VKRIALLSIALALGACQSNQRDSSPTLLKKLTVASAGRSQGNGIYYSCGPLTSTFSPEKAKTYLVEFQFKTGRCEQQVYDVTEAGQRVLVAGGGSTAQES
jgi:hypothetical protein